MDNGSVFSVLSATAAHNRAVGFGKQQDQVAEKARKGSHFTKTPAMRLLHLSGPEYTAATRFREAPTVAEKFDRGKFLGSIRPRSEDSEPEERPNRVYLGHGKWRVVRNVGA